MISESMLVAVLGFSPGSYVSPPEEPPTCAPVPPAPERIDAQPLAGAAVDGTQSWGATATYRLSSGETGETFMMIDDKGFGEAQLMVDGEIIVHVAITARPDGQPVITQWVPDALNASPEAIAEMMRVDLPTIVADNIPQEFKCSDWGRKVMKAGKYMVGTALAAGAAACCIASQGLACVVCAGGAWAGTEASSDFADGYCD